MVKNILSQQFIKKHGEKTNGLQHASHNKMLPRVWKKMPKSHINNADSQSSLMPSKETPLAKEKVNLNKFISCSKTKYLLSRVSPHFFFCGV